MTDGPIDCRAGDPRDRPRLEDPAVFNRPVETNAPKGGVVSSLTDQLDAERSRVCDLAFAATDEGLMARAQVLAMLYVGDCIRALLAAGATPNNETSDATEGR